jgi:hypothetical protein
MSRDREWLVVSVVTANYLNQESLLRLSASRRSSDQEIVSLETVFDGDIPVRITIHQHGTESAWVEWRLWPDEGGRRTFGAFALRRHPGQHLELIAGGTYDRATKRSARLARIPSPAAQHGLRCSAFEQFGILAG